MSIFAHVAVAAAYYGGGTPTIVGQVYRQFNRYCGAAAAEQIDYSGRALLSSHGCRPLKTVSISRLLQQCGRQMPPFPALQLPTHSGNQGTSCLRRNNYAQKKNNNNAVTLFLAHLSKLLLQRKCYFRAVPTALPLGHKLIFYNCTADDGVRCMLTVCTHRHTAGACCQSPLTPP